MSSWDRYLMDFAVHAASRSKDSTKVGAVLVRRPYNAVILTGYNGPPIGVADTPDRFVRPKKYLYASHAEANCLAFAARLGITTDGCSIYVTHPPCSSCAKAIIQAGIVEVVFGEGQVNKPDPEDVGAMADMFYEAGVKLYQLGVDKRKSIL